MRIVYYPDPVLLREALPLESPPENFAEIIAGMRHVMKVEKGIGLAAPQIGLSLRLILINETGEEGEEKILINPVIKQRFGKKVWGDEGCLSFPGIWGEVLRHSDVEVSYRNLQFEECSLEAKDLLARVLQHEIDHLDGKIFVTKMREADRKKNRAQLQELKDNYEALKA